MTYNVESKSEPLDNIFDDFLQSPSAFKRRDVLGISFVPQNLPHRDNQIKSLGYTLASVLRGATPSNLLLYGKTGTGKTASAKYVLQKLSSKASSRGYSMSYAYLNCHAVDTNYRVFADLCKELNISVPFTGLATDEVYSRFKSALDEMNSLFIIVLDEIDALVKKSGDETLYHLTRINSVLKNSRVSLIGISNDLKFKDLLDPRVLSSLSEEEIVFPPYCANELQDILIERAGIAFCEGALEPDVIPMIAAIAAREHGDARRAMDLLRVAGEIAERSGSQVVCRPHVKEAQGAIERNTVYEVVSTLPLQSKVVISALYYLADTEKRDKITTGEAYNAYVEICNDLGFDILTDRRVSDLIKELVILGIVDARVVSRGRYGRTKRIRFNVPTSLIRESLEKNEYLNKYLG